MLVSQTRPQLRRRLLVHDPGGALAAQHPVVHRVVGIALDVAQLAVAQVHANPAAAGAHVAGGVLDLVRNRRRGIEPALLQTAFWHWRLLTLLFKHV